MRLAEIRCETCPLWKRTAMIPDRGHCLNQPPYATANDHACSEHPLWQQALAEEEEREKESGVCMNRWDAEGRR